MSEISIEELKDAVQNQLVCKAWFIQSVRVHETHNGQTVWDGTVSVFDLDYHADITRAYAWSTELPDGKRRLFVIEHKPPVDSPEKAVRAVIAAEQKENR